MQLMCHRPRTQRLGEDSMPRELTVFTGPAGQARKMMNDIRIAHKNMVDAGYPWPGGNAHGWQSQPNDSYYLRLDN